MPEGEDPLTPFLVAVSGQLRGSGASVPAPSVRQLRRLIDEAAAGAPPALLRTPAVLSSFFANLDLLPPAGDVRADEIVALVRTANEASHPA